MTLYDAILSGKPFRRTGWTGWVVSERNYLHFDSGIEYTPCTDDLLANDWIVQQDVPKKLTSTNDYQKWSLTKDRSTESYGELHERLNKVSLQRLHAVLGLAGEVGELVDAVKKSVLYDKTLDVTNVKEECGDILWYMALMLDTVGSNFKEVMQMNHDKLEKRYPSGYSNKDAVERKDKV